MSAQQILYDKPGPKAVRRDKILNIVFTLLFVALAAWLVYDAYQRGIFNDRWSVLWNPTKGNQTGIDVWYSLIVRGVWGTLKPVLIATPIAMILAIVVTTMRVSPKWFSRIPARVLTEVFRGIPVLLVIYFGVLALNLEPLGAVVLGLVVYNTAVIAEILRAGIAALPSGQREAGLSIGLSHLQVLLMIELPQAVRIMLPALVSQVVVLLKDSSLGYIVGYTELLTTLRRNYNYFGEQTTVVFVLVGLVLYVLINMAVSWLAHWLERKLSSSSKQIVGDDPAVVDVVNAVEVGTQPRAPDTTR